jgi:murein DD-endopeptidase MepM/ murein hydrolase activator NlpD
VDTGAIRAHVSLVMGDRKLLGSRAWLLVLVSLAVVPCLALRGEAMPRAAASERVSGRESTPPQRTKRPAGIYHPLQEGQTLSTLSRAYRVPVAILISANRIDDPRSIRAGTPIFIPGARRILSIPENQTPPLAWPLEGRIMTPFNAPGWRRHDGIDIDGEMGQIIRAAATGRVLDAGRDGRYGKAILLDHGGNLTTYYAHASRLLVKKGDWVEQGDPIAEVGCSGNARGTHLHFEARRNGRPMDPLRLLPVSTAAAASRR